MQPDIYHPPSVNSIGSQAAPQSEEQLQEESQEDEAYSEQEDQSYNHLTAGSNNEVESPSESEGEEMVDEFPPSDGHRQITASQARHMTQEEINEAVEEGAEFLPEGYRSEWEIRSYTF